CLGRERSEYVFTQSFHPGAPPPDDHEAFSLASCGKIPERAESDGCHPGSYPFQCGTTRIRVDQDTHGTGPFCGWWYCCVLRLHRADRFKSHKHLRDCTKHELLPL